MEILVKEMTAGGEYVWNIMSLRTCHCFVVIDGGS